MLYMLTHGKEVGAGLDRTGYDLRLSDFLAYGPFYLNLAPRAKTFFMLDSAEHEIYPADKYQNNIFPAEKSWVWN